MTGKSIEVVVRVRAILVVSGLALGCGGRVGGEDSPDGGTTAAADAETTPPMDGATVSAVDAGAWETETATSADSGSSETETSCGDTRSDKNNCGTCGHVCADHEGCARGACRIGWTIALGGAATDETGTGIAVDAASNSFIVGNWSSAYPATTDLGGGPIDSSGLGDVFLVSLNAAGEFRWAQDIGGTALDQVGATYAGEGGSITVDASGNVFITGATVSTTLNFDADHAVARPLLGSPGNAFVASYTNDGRYRWGKIFGGPSWGGAIAVDATGNVFVGGGLQGTADFGTGSLTAFGGEEVFVASFTNDASPRWAHIYGSPGLNSLNSIATDASGNVYCTGHITSSASFGGAALPFTLGAGSETFVASYTNEGDHRWSKSFSEYEPSGANDAFAIAADALGHVAVGGGFNSRADFGGGPVVATSEGREEGYLVLLDAVDGTFEKQRFINSPTNSSVTGLGFDGAGNLFAAGITDGTGADFGGGPVANSGAFEAAYTNSLEYRFARVALGTIDVGDFAYGIAVTPSGNVYLTGQDYPFADFGFGSATTHGGLDMFVALLP